VGIARTVLLAASTSVWLRNRATRTGFVRRSVSAFMPGERIDDAVAVAVVEQRDGVNTIFTRLGENLTRVEDAEDVTRHYLEVIDRISLQGLRTHISVKPTQLGLDFDAEQCFRNLQRLVDRADQSNNFVWLDMERSVYVDRTLDLFRRTRARSPRIGVALQACLQRTEADVESLLPLAPAIRLVKGAYLEPASIAFARKSDVDENFYRLACRMLDAAALRSGPFVHIATHDHGLVSRIRTFIEEHRIPTSAYEFAMLYGIQRPLQQRLARAGCPLRVLVSYGDDWYPWYMRRLAERPANVWFVLKNIVAR
jgi:proline dehydrogenase